MLTVCDGTLRPATQQKLATRKPSMLPTESPNRNDMFSPSEKKAGPENNFPGVPQKHKVCRDGAVKQQCVDLAAKNSSGQTHPSARRAQSVKDVDGCKREQFVKKAQLA